MSITNDSELLGVKKVSEAVATTLKEMRSYARPGITTKALDLYGTKILGGFGARSAPYLTYGFPGFTCISVNNEFCHGIPTDSRILQEGDLINIDVSAELEGYWSDNGSSFVLGQDLHGHQFLVAVHLIATGVIPPASGKIRWWRWKPLLPPPLPMPKPGPMAGRWWVTGAAL